MKIDSPCWLLLATALLAGCQSNETKQPFPSEEAATEALVTAAPDDDGADDDTEAYDGIDERERVDFTGTEPFWGGHVVGPTLTYETPEDPNGEIIQVQRFAGRGGISYSGLLEGDDFTMMVTPLKCSDGMSDRTYPFTVTLQIGKETRNGCGWTDKRPFEGPEHP